MKPFCSICHPLKTPYSLTINYVFSKQMKMTISIGSFLKPSGSDSHAEPRPVAERRRDDGNQEQDGALNAQRPSPQSGGVMRRCLDKLMTDRATKPAVRLTPTEQETVDASTLPAHLKDEICHALRKAGIPINRTSIADVERFHDEKLTSAMEDLTPGNVSSVSKARYGAFVGVFRVPGAGLLSQGVRLIETSSAPCRDKATYLLDRKMAFGVIPHTAFAVHKNQTGKTKAGIVMEFAPGVSPVISLKREEISETEIGRKLLDVKELMKDPRFKKKQCALLGIRDCEFGDNNRVFVSYLHSPVGLDNAVAKQDLVKLQILDYLAGQVDRHSKNYIVNTDPHTGEISGVRGIDNDLSFERNFKILNAINHKILHRHIIVGLPEVVDKEMCKAINALSKEELSAMFAGLLPEREIEAVNRRLDKLKQHISRHPELVIEPADWDKVQFLDARRSYVARDRAYQDLPFVPRSVAAPAG